MWKGAGEGAKDLICMTLGTGVGGGVIANGEIVHGVSGVLVRLDILQSLQKMLSHVIAGSPLLRNSSICDRYCTCCYAKIQETNKESMLRSMLAEEGRITSKDVFEALGQGDELAGEVVEK